MAKDIVTVYYKCKQKKKKKNCSHLSTYMGAPINEHSVKVTDKAVPPSVAAFVDD
jgi:hypothetical protein